MIHHSDAPSSASARRTGAPSPRAPAIDDPRRARPAGHPDHEHDDAEILPNGRLSARPCSSATMTIASGRNGITRNQSSSAVRPWSTAPPKYPAAMPHAPPISADDDGRRHAHDERHARAQEEQREHVAAVLVRAEPVRGARRLQDVREVEADEDASGSCGAIHGPMIGDHHEEREQHEPDQPALVLAQQLEPAHGAAPEAGRALGLAAPWRRSATVSAVSTGHQVFLTRGSRHV